MPPNNNQPQRPPASAQGRRARKREGRHDESPGTHDGVRLHQRTSVVGTAKLKPGKNTLKLDFAYDGGGPGKGGTATLSVNDVKAAEGKLPHTQAGLFSADETADVGIDLGTPVGEAIGCEHKSKFTGHISKVTIEVK